MPGPGGCLQAAALPTFFSPFEWRLIRQQSDGYELRDVTLGRGTLAQIFVPSQQRRLGRARTAHDDRAASSTGSRASPPRARRRCPTAHGASARWTCAFSVRRRAGWSPTRRCAPPFVMTIEIASDGAVRSERLGN